MHFLERTSVPLTRCHRWRDWLGGIDEEGFKERSVARSRQVYIYWLWKHFLLLSIYLEKEHILIDIGKYDRQVVLTDET
jgi:hypothetical protein